jgi:uncharacterized protein YbjT (DUF2867 family)
VIVQALPAGNTASNKSRHTPAAPNQRNAMNRTVLITGATGNVSTSLLNALRGSQLKLRALVRNPSKAAHLQASGVAVFAGDLDDSSSLARAFEGVDDLWLLSPPSPRAPENSMNALWAARQAGVKRVVRMSAIGAAHDAPTRNGRLHALSDHELQHSDMQWTILRPHFFMQNLLGFAPAIAADGRFYLDFGSARLGLVDVRDIGELAARVLMDEPQRHHKKIYTVTGPESITMNQAAESIAEVLGKPVQYVPVPHEVVRENLLKMGIPEWTAGLTIEYGAAYSAGWGDFTTSHFEEVTGKPARSFATFARELWPRA